jgi:hypothetical protein
MHVLIAHSVLANNLVQMVTFFWRDMIKDILPRDNNGTVVVFHNPWYERREIRFAAPRTVRDKQLLRTLPARRHSPTESTALTRYTWAAETFMIQLSITWL